MKKVLSIIVSLMLIVSPVYALDSNGVIYDNSTSGSSATNVNDALNDLYSKLNEKQTEINNIKNIGNATSDKILSGYTAYVKGNTITGSIPSKGAATYTPGTVNQTIASGQYLSGAQTIKGDANLIAGNIAKGKSIFGVSGSYTSDANAVAGNILSGKTAYINGSKITGTIPTLATTASASTGTKHANATGIVSGAHSTNDTINYLYLGIPKNTYTGDNAWIRTPMSEVVKQLPNKTATTYTPGVSNQTIASGQYLSGAQTIKGDANLIASNIAKGKSIFGVSGSYTSDATATAADIKSGKTAYVNGIKITGSSNSLSLGDTITSSLASKKTTAELVVPIGVTKGFLIVNAITTMRKTVSSEISGSGVVTQKSTDAGTISRGDQNAYVNTKIYEAELAPGGTVTANVLNYYSSTYVGVSIILLA